jgi:hypothetical protein
MNYEDEADEIQRVYSGSWLADGDDAARIANAPGLSGWRDYVIGLYRALIRWLRE